MYVHRSNIITDRSIHCVLKLTELCYNWLLRNLKGLFKSYCVYFEVDVYLCYDCSTWISWLPLHMYILQTGYFKYLYYYIY